MIFCKITTSRALYLPTQQQEFFKDNIAQQAIYTTQLATNQPPPLVIAIFFAHWQTKVNKVSTDQVHPSHETAFIFRAPKCVDLGSRVHYGSLYGWVVTMLRPKWPLADCSGGEEEQKPTGLSGDGGSRRQMSRPFEGRS